jgi:hypothetical protein
MKEQTKFCPSIQWNITQPAKGRSSCSSYSIDITLTEISQMQQEKYGRISLT